VSAGILLFRKKDRTFEVLLAHPGGPFFSGKDEGVWTIPKGEAAPGEDLLQRAQIEFQEEVGVALPGQARFLPLGSIAQKGGKTVHAWAAEINLAGPLEVRSNTFKLEWPPRSGKWQSFPEIDQANFFSDEMARRKINPAQTAFLDRLREHLDSAIFAE
jgi:predicted NUDIX family NTP pyrophosphohydrolase